VLNWVGRTQKDIVASFGTAFRLVGPNTAIPFLVVLKVRWLEEDKQSVVDDESY
jgi:hypothetical protein